MVYPLGGRTTQRSSPATESLGPNGSRSFGPCGQGCSPSVEFPVRNLCCDSPERARRMHWMTVATASNSTRSGPLSRESRDAVCSTAAGRVKAPHSCQAKVTTTLNQTIYHCLEILGRPFKREELDARSEELGMGSCQLDLRR